MKTTNFVLREKDWGPSYLVIDRLDPYAGKMCCLGQVGVQLGVDADLMRGSCMPHDFLELYYLGLTGAIGKGIEDYGEFDLATRTPASPELKKLYTQTFGELKSKDISIAGLLADANDTYFEDHRTVERRSGAIAVLTAGFAEAGFTLTVELDDSTLSGDTFVDEYNEDEDDGL